MESQMIEGTIRIIQTVGFPIGCCLWFMLRLEKRLDEQTRILNDIAVALKGLALSHDHRED